MTGQIGYRSKAYRGVTAIPYVRNITPPTPSRAKIDATNMDSANFTKEYVAGFIDFPEAQYECVSDVSNAVQNLIETDFLAGLTTPEAWSHKIADPDAGTILRTYSYSGYLTDATRGPIGTEDLIILNIKVQLSSSITAS